MKSSLAIFTLAVLGYCNISLCGVVAYEETTYTLETHYECPNKKKFERLDAAQKECGNKAQLVDQDGKPVSLESLL